MNILFIYGTRPEAIKMAPLVKALQKDNRFSVKICVTGQHREMLDQVLDFFKIIPDFDLNLMQPNQSLLQLLGNFFHTIEPVLDEVQPDLVFVQGDTSSVMAGAIAAFLKKVRVAHLEAGLRTGDKYSPFPEEINRILTSNVTDFHFAPTTLAINNLNKEGIRQNIWNVGNTVVDALFLGLDIIRERGESDFYKFFEEVDFTKKVILVTSHRRESFGQPMQNTCEAIRILAESHSDVEFVFPVHLNPLVQEVVKQELSGVSGVNLIDPLDYPRLIWLMSKSYLVLTDSGGIQEEAPSLGKPVLVLREVTERQEGIDAGTAVLVGTDRDLIIQWVEKLLNDPGFHGKMADAINPYGDGTTSIQILDILSGLIN